MALSEDRIREIIREELAAAMAPPHQHTSSPKTASDTASARRAALHAWFAQRISFTKSPDDFVPSADIWHAYLADAGAQGLRPVSRILLARELIGVIYAPDPVDKYRQDRKQVGGTLVRGFYGIRLKPVT